jgi:hypothetical protein
MRKTIVMLLAVWAAVSAAAQALPDKFEVKYKGKNHVQGVAVDTVAKCFYLSFTTSLVKTDYEGNVLASVDTINGHLGAMTFDAPSRKLYASLECKDDEIGQGIAKNLGKEAYSKESSRFYIVEADVDRLSGPGTPASEVMKFYPVTEAIRDYKTRYGCSGIDGVTIAPRIGKKPGKPCLYVAYGIYNDISRRDNDHQILLEYRLGKLQKHTAKYFVFTGNTNWGVQNLCYDANTGCVFMACYAGKKPEYPNYTLFAVPVMQKPGKKVLLGLENDGRHPVLALWNQGLLSSVKGVRGWRFGDAATGFCTTGDGVWYVSKSVKRGKMYTAAVRRLEWKGGPGEVPFNEVKR